ncbi:hypothetical protein FRC12_019071 [Ceratobasidium sp. 428]|nr:hypothetical protein FRC12_019071 [Ceratobasidium sp. 428]
MQFSSHLYESDGTGGHELLDSRVDPDIAYTPHRVASYHAILFHLEEIVATDTTTKTQAMIEIDNLLLHNSVHHLAARHISNFSEMMSKYSEDSYILFRLGYVLNKLLAENPIDTRAQAPERTSIFLGTHGLRNLLATIELRRIKARENTLLPYLKLLWRFKHEEQVAQYLVSQDLHGVRCILDLLSYDSIEARGWIIGVLWKYKFHREFTEGLIRLDANSKILYLIENE